MTELATIDDTTTDIIPGQVGFNSAQKAMLAQLGLSDAPEGDLILFSHVCQKSGLDPFRREIYMIGRNSQVTKYVPNASGEGQHKETRWETVYTIQTGIQGFRKRARELAEEKDVRIGFNGPYWCGEDGQWTEVWPEKKNPVAAKYIVFRDGEPVPAVCHFDEYVQTVKSDGQEKPNSMWARMPRNQLAKCAEAAALQRAFPDELSGLLLEDAAMHTVVDETGAEEQPAQTRRGGKGTNGLRERAQQARQENTVVDAEAVETPDTPGTETEPGTAEQVKSPMRKAVEKRLFSLIGKIDPPLERDDRILVYRGITGRAEIASTDDLSDVEVTRIGDQIYQWDQDGQVDDKIRDLLNAAVLATESRP